MEQLLKPAKYVDPMIDVAFKQIFAKEKNKKLMKGLLENVFRLTITDLRFANVEHHDYALDDRGAVFDVECHSDSIGDFIVEVQVKEQRHFAKRALYYSTFPISAQAPKGKWDYDFKPVFFLGLLNFDLPEVFGKEEGCVHRYSFRNDNTGQQMPEMLQFVFMEVGRFDKALEECNTFEDKFLYFLKNLPTFVEKPLTLQDEYFDDLIQAAEYANLDRKEMDEYNRRLFILRDNQNAEEFMIEKATKTGLERGMAEGLEKGMAQGIEQGIKQGIEQGLAQGMAEGEAQSTRNIARNLLKRGFEVSVISDITGLDETGIRSLEAN